ncbi:CCR4-NOT regulatory complex component [Physocladia obscura]|uniref:CCR4-NOT regulatory complex component n=1 Tax=Physocladia obscura TaxID=109957 RepID=A0AAD5T1C0_9FUNG|nr:CCR4-NOT regulatory complex component [Physocladia obscura]
MFTTKHDHEHDEYDNFDNDLPELPPAVTLENLEQFKAQTQNSQTNNSSGNNKNKSNNISYSHTGDKHAALFIENLVASRPQILPPAVSATPPPAISDTPLADTNLADSSEVPKPKRIKKEVAKLDSARLLAPSGLPILAKMSKIIKLKGKKHEFEDLQSIVFQYQKWGHQVFNKLVFSSFVESAEKICRERRVKIWRDELIKEDYRRAKGYYDNNEQNKSNSLENDDFDVTMVDVHDSETAKSSNIPLTHALFAIDELNRDEEDEMTRMAERVEGEMRNGNVGGSNIQKTATKYALSVEDQDDWADFDSQIDQQLLGYVRTAEANAFETQKKERDYESYDEEENFDDDELEYIRLLDGTENNINGGASITEIRKKEVATGNKVETAVSMKYKEPADQTYEENFEDDWDDDEAEKIDAAKPIDVGHAGGGGAVEAAVSVVDIVTDAEDKRIADEEVALIPSHAEIPGTGTTTWYAAVVHLLTCVPTLTMLAVAVALPRLASTSPGLGFVARLDGGYQLAPSLEALTPSTSITAPTSAGLSFTLTVSPSVARTSARPSNASAISPSAIANAISNAKATANSSILLQNTVRLVQASPAQAAVLFPVPPSFIFGEDGDGIASVTFAFGFVEVCADFYSTPTNISEAVVAADSLAVESMWALEITAIILHFLSLCIMWYGVSIIASAAIRAYWIPLPSFSENKGVLKRVGSLRWLLGRRSFSATTGDSVRADGHVDGDEERAQLGFNARRAAFEAYGAKWLLCSFVFQVLSGEGITYLGTEWAHNPIVRRDVPESRLLKTLGAERHQERCSRLLEIMDVNVDWHMHEVSDGQRRRVQIVLGLMEPWDILLLDEVTVDLDVLVRKDLVDFLKEEATLRNATIIYATHI